MTEGSPLKRRKASIRTVVGWALTGVWVVGVAITFVMPDVLPFKLKPPDRLNELGDTLAGFAAPLAFLWLVLGYMQQGDELAKQREETNRLVKEANAQAAATRDQECHLRRDIYLKTHDLLHAQQNLTASRIIKDIDEREVTRDKWSQYKEGDDDIFFNISLRVIKREARENSGEVLLGEGRKQDVERFLKNFEFLQREADRVDQTDGNFRGILDQSGMGELYTLLRSGKGGVPSEEASGLDGVLPKLKLIFAEDKH